MVVVVVGVITKIITSLFNINITKSRNESQISTKHTKEIKASQRNHLEAQ